MDQTRTISRSEAISAIYEAMTNDSFDKELIEPFTEIAAMLEHEIFGIDAWGVPGEEYGELVAVYDPESPEYEKHTEEVKRITEAWKLGHKALCQEDQQYLNDRISGFYKEGEEA